MKIALVHYTALPVVGGVEVVMAAHARLFADAGHEVTIVCQRGGSSDPRISVELLSSGSTESLEGTLVRQDVVMIHNVCTMPFDLPLTEALWTSARELRNTRFICWVHDLAACNPDYKLHDNAAQLSRAHERLEYVAISEHRRQQILRLTGVDARVIPNGVEPAHVLDLTEPVAAFAARNRILECDIVLLHPARLLPRKRIDVSLRVAGELRARGLTCALIITAAADPHQKSRHALDLRQLKRELALEGTAFFISDELEVSPGDLASLYRLADALLYPSRDEGFGLPILEAALHRLPIFCTDVAPLNSQLRSGVHVFAAVADPAEIAARIAQHIAAAPEAQARKQVARDLSWEAIDRKYLAPLLAETASSTPP